MTITDREAFGKAFYALGEAFSERVSDLKTEAYFDALSDLPVLDVLTAMRTSIRTSRFFPRPVELRELIEGTATDRAERSWNALRQEIRRVGWMGEPTWPDEATKAVTLAMFGSWRGCCEQMPESGPEMLGLAKRFTSTYTAQARVPTAPALPPARDEGDVPLLRERMLAITKHTGGKR